MTKPSSALLDVRDLRVQVGERTILHSVSLQAEPGSLSVLMGANGSGKSTLGMALAGHPHYRVLGGQALLEGQDLLALPAHERARAGLFVSLQAPPDIPGVKNNLFLRTALNAVRAARGEEPLDAFDFIASAKAAARDLSLPEALLGRPVNEGFSGGERKRNELLQLALLRPRVALLDEIDSGLDVDGVRAVVALIGRLRAQGTAILVVSHYLHMIEQLAPDAVLRLDQGCIAETGGLELARGIARTGFARAAEPALEA
ncbi:Fe-S cluster assembly ATP-binding protein [Oryzisolibacter propanilivorax]|uniref:Fe-S cluster assembly ATP-binding protein n=1 Tax=Oryzisolibacter propanilivorax TaxID=1527607 RepID=A0A1G9STF8_9BURK|nr:Fe-S cluster assembly ATPase SufC [Oryzisolibacter propanilivorax]SDM38749.1 Fe-S cluster assembly ATP-binding protein [Oryzisolibacter propanilivorax]